MAESHKTTEDFMEAYEKYSDAIFRHCFYRVYDREKAQDLMQEAFVRTWEQIQNGKEIENVRAFLYRVANNLVIDYSRKKKESSLEVMMETGFEPGDGTKLDTETQIDADLALKAMKGMDEKSREVIVMRYVDGLGPNEIAEITGDTPNAVSVRLSRAIRSAKKLFVSNVLGQ